MSVGQMEADKTRIVDQYRCGVIHATD